MPTRVRGKGKGPMRGEPSSHAGPSHRSTPSASFSSSDSCDDWRHSLEPARRSVSLGTSPSYHYSFGPDEPQHFHHSQHSLHSHSFHHSFHHLSHYSHSHNSYSQGHFKPDDLSMHHRVITPMPLSGMPTHPISISSGSSFAGSPYRGPDTYKEWFGQWDFVNTPSFHNTPPQPPLEEPHFEAVTPPPLPVEEPPQPPPEPPRRRRNARLSVRRGPRFSSPQASRNYPPIPEDPQMGGPSHAVMEIDTTPVTFAPRHRQWVMKTQYLLTQVRLGITRLNIKLLWVTNIKLLLTTHMLKQLTLTLFIPHRFHQHNKLGIPYKGSNTLLINSNLNLNLDLNNYKRKKSYKGLE
ncbi:hypothetical protein Hanom_Chr10g00902171 [Helianthus anomalus]